MSRLRVKRERDRLAEVVVIARKLESELPPGWGFLTRDGELCVSERDDGLSFWLSARLGGLEYQAPVDVMPDECDDQVLARARGVIAAMNASLRREPSLWN